MRKIWMIFVFLSLLPLAHAAAPVCLFQDVLSGQATGGEGGNGIYLSIFGVNFGATQGTSTVTVNGTPVSQYIYWGADVTGNHQQVGVQIASATSGTGSVVITTPAGSSTCPNTFTVRSGSIWYIGSGTDTNTISNPTCAQLEADTAPGDVGNGGTGAYANPWKLSTSNASSSTTQRTPYTYYNCITAGDTIVFLNGANFLWDDGSGLHASLALKLNKGSSSAGTYLVIEARPSATVTLGGSAGESQGYGIRNSDSNVTISGITLIGDTGGSGLSSTQGGTYPANMRIVNNIVECPYCTGASANLTAGWSADNETQIGNVGVEVLGDWVYNAGCSVSGGVPDKEFHFIYTNGNGEELAWNKVGGTGATAGCAQNGIQINYYAETSIGFGNLSVHDNDVSYADGAGINLPTVDPSIGPINVYNNVVHHTGVIPSGTGGSFFAGIAFPGYAPSAGAGTVNVYNNTLYDNSYYLNTANTYKTASCAVYVGNPVGQPLTVNLVNNIIAEPSYTYTSSANVYFCGSGTSEITGSNNLFYSASTPSSSTPPTGTGLTALTIPTDPLFASTTTPGPWTNLELQSTSPAISAGSASLYPTLDFAGKTRPSSPAIGALEYQGGGSSSNAGMSGNVSITGGGKLQ
jgi:hypothetical protein